MNIEVRDLSKNYFLEGKIIPVLKNLSLTFSSGEMVSLTGPSGVGKSTFLHVLGTLDTPSNGAIFYDGIAVHNLTDRKIAAFRNERVGYVFQFHHLMVEFSAAENVMMPLLMRRINVDQAKAQAEKVLSFVGLSHRVDHKPGELSGGEQQRVALARALVHEPSLLLADEPTGNLDEKTGDEIIELIRRYNQEHGTTVILVTHNRRISESFTTRLVFEPAVH